MRRAPVGRSVFWIATGRTIRGDSGTSAERSVGRERWPAYLFYWEAGDVRRFFFRQGEGDPQPLINRRYRNRQLIVRQELYRGQLRSSVNCGTTDETLRRLMYTRTAFVQYFEAYNDCREVNYRVSFRDRSARPFRFAFRPGVEFYVGHTASTSALGIQSRALFRLRQPGGWA